MQVIENTQQAPWYRGLKQQPACEGKTVEVRTAETIQHCEKFYPEREYLDKSATDHLRRGLYNAILTLRTKTAIGWHMDRKVERQSTYKPVLLKAVA